VLRFRVLGRLEVLDGEAAGETPVAVSQGKQSVLLAALLLRANQLVSVEQLIDWLWEREPPSEPRRALQVCVARLRRVLADDPAAAVLTTRPGGYLIQASPATLDLLRVRELLAPASGAPAADPAAESARLAEALSLWQHPALPDVPSDALQRDEIGRLNEEWAHTVERRIDADLLLGRHRELVAELAGLVARFPLRERFWAQLMTALYRSGRQADALAQYERLRRQLADDLGLDPGSDLQQLHKQILTGDLAVDPTAAAAPGPAAPARPPVPAQLPTDLASFTGRAAELDRLLALPGGPAAAVAVGVVDGMAGVGKTALAVHAAHRLAGRFPDGQLFLDLHGFTHAAAPVEPADALDRLLRSLGVPGEQIPAHLDDRAALLRSRLAGTRTLIVLDDAAGEAQVRPLLPGAPGCLVLVTSRRRLTGLDDAHPVPLDLLPAADAAALFSHAAGAGRVGAESLAAVAEVVDLCGRLPLAIRIAAARLRARPAWTVAHVADRLRAHQSRLDELDAGQRSVTAALDLSYRHLTDDQKRLYRLLGAHPGTDIEPHAAAALAGVTGAAAARLLDDLVDCHLLGEPSPGRYQFHDLTRAHASADEETEPDRQAALARLFDHYAGTASAAMDLVYPYEADQRPRPPAPVRPPAAVDSPAAAEAWLDLELENLLAAAAAGRPDHTLHQSATLHRHLRTRARYNQAEALHQRALAAARDTGDGGAEVTALTCLGDVHRLRGRYGPAVDCYRQALDIARSAGHRRGELGARSGLGWVETMQGRYEPAVGNYLQALEIAREIGHRGGEVDVLNGLGNVNIMHDRYDPAADCLGRALEIARSIGHRVGELTALVGLGWVHGFRGRYDAAIEDYERALEIARRVGHRGGEVDALTGLGYAHRAQRRYGPAADSYRQVLVIARQIGNRAGELAGLIGLGDADRARGRYGPAADRYREVLGIARAAGDRNLQFEAHHGIGHVHHATGRPDEALRCHQQALELARDLGQPSDQARAHDGLAHAQEALGQPELARQHWLHTLDILATLGTDHTFDEHVTAATIRAHLAGLDRDRSLSPVSGR
jgi:DNA-binding SARP family transcriptional activator/tetratricopeptide (TPR) repeat protein